MTVKISMRELLKAGVHFGHKSSCWNPKMQPYIFGERQKIHIINLERTLPMFRDALQEVAKMAAKNQRVLFVGTKYAARDIIKEQAIRCGMPYVNYRWLGGMLTNYKTIKESVKRLKELEFTLDQDHILQKKTKKEILSMTRAKNKLSLSLGGIKEMKGPPEAVFVIDVNEEKIAVDEAKRLGIKVIAVVDSNSNPDGIDFPIPGNDDAARAIQLYSSSMAETIIQSRGVVVEKKEKSTTIRKKPSALQVDSSSNNKDGGAEVETKIESAVPEVQVEKPQLVKVVKKKTSEELAKVVAQKKPAAKKKAAPKKKAAAKKKVAATKKPAAKKKAPAKKKDSTDTAK
jgi:small subunit ribosomal protein S2